MFVQSAQSEMPRAIDKKTETPNPRRRGGIDTGKHAIVLDTQSCHEIEPCSQTSLVCAGPPVTIVLAAYNGQEYIREQIESLQQQTYANWTLLVRDDSSSDRTVDIVRELANHDDRITLLNDAQGWLGTTQNFGTLLKAAYDADAPYVLFADQDDVWHPEKIARQMELILCAEDEDGRNVPQLVHSDLAVVDEELRLIHDSFMGYEGLAHSPHQPLKTLLVQNFVTGCTALVNRALLELAVPIPTDAALHDWWLALCAATTGRIHYLPAATVRYRQHSKNCVGARSTHVHIGRLLSNLPAYVGRHTANLTAGIGQARTLLRRLESTTNADDDRAQLVRLFCQKFESQQGKFQRISRVMKLGIRRQSRLKQLSLLLQLPLVPVLPQ
ncbi:UDP-Glc:alpha-D-GlcNAc-diphosphoundecaprenol beta-1,3-glucosyltransferase WfgD [Symmachiella macrocystis]|uniref:UDP-Glc:alpha-D-GlcNAc-diphosphoundecaprenol beta-1,3-glucosyltransferase WfgD n=2 Tax=Symmachiella macrocystis TaxID=2527985 RepID=A0A5C6BPF4_9PLAN|nr:UDP-Glc:alpha-D-GlcNAc-diphosphoundecaprenol beta-1,3-glucosyltransferase WfgD [Symmachiella macrocystis]